jgi:glyoxylase I family protein
MSDAKSASKPFRVFGLDHLVLRVRDLDVMRDFYVNTLGGVVQEHDTDLGLLQVRMGAQIVDLVPVDGKAGRAGGAAPGREGRNVDHFALRIDPFDDAAIRAYLTARGIECGDTKIRGGAEGEGPGMYITDPEGNTVELKGPPDPAYN